MTENRSPRRVSTVKTQNNSSRAPHYPNTWEGYASENATHTQWLISSITGCRESVETDYDRHVEVSSPSC